jgi:hypothetical protein
VALGVVVGLVYLNQVLFTVYVSRVYGGDASFIARYLPSGWFAMATDNSVLEAVARRFPAPELLAPTVLRVQAFLELPFVLFAFLTVLRWLDRGWYARVARSPLVWAAAVAYTLVFCAVEWELRNPYTVDDVIVRTVAAIVTPPLIIWLARPEEGGQRPISAPALAAFAISAWALGYLILFVYDTALLYNLAHVRDRLYGAATALAVLLSARLMADRLPAYGVGTGVSAITVGLRWSLALLFCPRARGALRRQFRHPACRRDGRRPDRAGRCMVRGTRRAAAGSPRPAAPVAHSTVPRRGRRTHRRVRGPTVVPRHALRGHPAPRRHRIPRHRHRCLRRDRQAPHEHPPSPDAMILFAALSIGYLRDSPVSIAQSGRIWSCDLMWSDRLRKGVPLVPSSDTVTREAITQRQRRGGMREDYAGDQARVGRHPDHLGQILTQSD